jgi:broad specificity phosphatase PhoE
MGSVFFITHPEVVIDPAVPVPRWHLSDRGIARMRTLGRSPMLAGVASIWASCETKAIEAAGILAGALVLPVAMEADLHENDRSATGYLPPPEFERVADAFFARPHESVRGWERAVDAQARILVAVERVLAAAPAGDVAIVAHGGVGALLLCRLLDVPIARAHDQPGPGSFFSFDRASRRLLAGWAPIA